MPLTDTAIRQAKPAVKPYRLHDERGLYLEVSPSGGKLWRFKYRFDNKEKRISLGTYPDISLKEARERRDQARKLVANEVDPSDHRKAKKASKAEQASNSFEIVAREWHNKFSKNWVESHSKRIITRLERDIFPFIGKRPVAEISAPELLRILRKIESRGALETAHRAMQNCGQVFRYAVATGRGDRDITADLRGALPPPQEKHHPSITNPSAIGALLRAIDGYDGYQITKSALMLAALTFVRPGELRGAKWCEIDIPKAEWRIPDVRMKMRVQHIVPLSAQSIRVLEELKQLTGYDQYLFPGARSSARPISENTVNAALRRLGYTKKEMTGHGFRSMASTLLNEMGFNPDAIERQLAHAERNGVRAAYNYAEYLPERRKMMQEWADYLDNLRGKSTE